MKDRMVLQFFGKGHTQAYDSGCSNSCFGCKRVLLHHLKSSNGISYYKDLPIALTYSSFSFIHLTSSCACLSVPHLSWVSSKAPEYFQSFLSIESANSWKQREVKKKKKQTYLLLGSTEISLALFSFPSSPHIDFYQVACREEEK